MLLRHDLDLKKRTVQWLEGEILPTLYKIWEQTEAMHNSVKMSLSNMRNRAVLLPSGIGEKFDATLLSHPLLQTIKSLQTIENELVALSENIKAKMAENFRLSNIYETSRPFLPLSLQHTVRQIEATRGWLLDQIAKWGSTRLALLHRLWYNLEKEESMGFSEKTARFIEHRQPDPANHHYTSIFLTKGFVGASFATGRQDQMSHFDNLVRQWEKGFRGAALLTGRRFCGKSFFGEWAATRHFPNNIIRLAARQETNFKGRKCPGTTNLAEVLDFVKKYALHDRPLLWLDDLELWQDADHSLFDNTAALLHFNDHHATRCFVMASINRWSHQHLQALLDIDRGFQATLKFDTMPVQNIAKAILIRHGATHKKLVSKDGIELFPGQVQRLVRRVEKAAHGNIGEALQSWAAAAHIADDDSVTIDFQDKYSLPSNFSPDMSLLLTEVLTQKRTDEYRLRKQFGQSFNDRYADLVRRLLGTGLLNRLPDGSLEINEDIVNALAGRLLKNG